MTAGFGGAGAKNTPYMFTWDPYKAILNSNAFMISHTAAVNALELINNTHLASGSEDTTAKIWELATGQCILTLDTFGKDKVKAIKLLSDGYLAGGGDGSFDIYIWSLKNGSVIKTLNGHTKKVNTIELLSNGDFASGGDDNIVYIWSSTFTQKTTLTSTDHVNCLKQTPNGFLVGVLNGKNANLCIWSLLLTLGSSFITIDAHASNVKSVEILSNGDIATSAEDNNVKIWSLRTYSLKFTLTGHTGHVKALKLLPNGLLASGSDDNHIKIWNTTSGSLVRDLPSPNNIDINYFALVVLPNKTEITFSTSKFETSTAANTKKSTKVETSRTKVASFAETSLTTKLETSTSEKQTLFQSPTNSVSSFQTTDLMISSQETTVFKEVSSPNPAIQSSVHETSVEMTSRPELTSALTSSIETSGNMVDSTAINLVTDEANTTQSTKIPETSFIFPTSTSPIEVLIQTSTFTITNTETGKLNELIKEIKQKIIKPIMHGS